MFFVAMMPESYFASVTRASDRQPVPTHLLSIGMVIARAALGVPDRVVDRPPSFIEFVNTAGQRHTERGLSKCRERRFDAPGSQTIWQPGQNRVGEVQLALCANDNTTGVVALWTPKRRETRRKATEPTAKNVSGVAEMLFGARDIQRTRGPRGQRFKQERQRVVRAVVLQVSTQPTGEIAQVTVTDCSVGGVFENRPGKPASGEVVLPREVIRVKIERELPSDAATAEV
jgi:hypothetical protein